MKEHLIKFLEKELKYKLDYNSILEKPKQSTQGDFSLPCFTISKKKSLNPVQIAKQLKEQLNKKLPDFLSEIKTIGPYLNFFLDSKYLIKNIIKSIESKQLFEIQNKGEKIVLEYPSPNTNKALHLGHLRNILLGNSLSKILTRANNKVIKVNLNNDKGIAICKAMLAYQMFGKNKTPKSKAMKSDKFVANYYVLFEIENKKNAKLKLEEKAQDLLLKWEAGDKKTIELWEKIMSWVFIGYKKTYTTFKVKHDKEYFESKIWNHGKEIVIEALKNNVKGFGEEKDGAIYCDLCEIKLDKKYLLRKDKTTLYITQDLYLAKIKEKNHNANRYITITSNEQNYHFQVLFEILKRLGSKSKNEHYSYGYISLPDGKMKSREGTVIDADELFETITTEAKNGLLSREISKKLPSKKLEKRSKKIAYSALAFFILKYNPKSDFVFNPKESLSMVGETGPYVQYTYARIKSILRKVNFGELEVDSQLYTNEKEIILMKFIAKYNEILIEASKDLKPSVICQYLIKLSQEFNNFYSDIPILKAEKQISQNRLYLIEKIAIIIKDGLELLDIETLEEM